MPDFVDPNKHPSRRYRALKPAGYEPENYEEYYGADEQAELFDIMQGVRPEDRFSGEYGLLPYLGYYGSGNPDDPAYGVSSINKYDTKYPFFRSETKLSSTWEDPNKLMRSPKSGTLGFYNPENIPFEEIGLAGDIKYLEGSEYPSPGHSGVSAFYPQEDFLPLTPEEQSTRIYTRGSPFLSSEEVRTGKVDLGEGSPHEAYVGNRAFPGVTVHELMHRGFYTEAVKDFSKEFGLDPSNVMPNDFFISPRTEAIDPYFQHIMIDSRDIADSIYSEQKDPAGIREPYRDILGNFQDQFLEWLTPEKQAKYDIDLPPQYRADGGPVSSKPPPDPMAEEFPFTEIVITGNFNRPTGDAPMSKREMDKFLDKLGTHRTDIFSRMQELEEGLPSDSPEYRLNRITAQNLDLSLTYLSDALKKEWYGRGRPEIPTDPQIKITRGQIAAIRAGELDEFNYYAEDSSFQEALKNAKKSLEEYLTLPFSRGNLDVLNLELEHDREKLPTHTEGSTTSPLSPGPYPYDRFEALQRGTERTYSDETGRRLSYPWASPNRRSEEDRAERPDREQQYLDFPYPEDDPQRDYELNRRLLGKRYREPLPGSRLQERMGFPPPELRWDPYSGNPKEGNALFEQLRRWDPYAEVSPEMRDLSVSEQMEGINYLNRADGGPVYLAAGGTGSNIDNAAFTPNVTTYLPNYAPSLQGYFDDIGGISKAQAHAMNTAIAEGLATLEEQDPSKWTQEQIDAFNTGIEDRIIAAAAADTNDVQLAAAAAAIEAGRLPTPLTENEKWEAWEEFLDAYEPSGDDNADIQDAAEKATELFGYGTDDGKVAFLTAAARAGITTEQVAEATGTTVASILANLPNLNPFDYAKEAITGVIDWLKTAQGKCLVGINGSLTCNFNQGGARTVGGTVSGVPVWKIPGTNTTVGVDLGNDLYNLVFGILTCRIGPSGGNTCPTLAQIPQIIIDATLAKIQGVITDKIREEVTQGVMEALSLQEDGSFTLGVDMEKYCYNDDGSVRQVLVGDSCPTGTSETDPGCPIVDGVQQVRDSVTGECKAPDTSGEGVVCYSDTDGSTVPALEDGTCPLGSSTTAPEAETAQTLCTTSGGLWENGACVCPTKSELKTDGPNSGKCMAAAINVNAQKEDCLATEGNTWDEAESKCYLADQTAVAAQNRCTESGGSWENGACVCTNVVGGADLVNGQCMVEAPNVNAQKEDCLATEGNTWDDVEKKCYLAAGTDNRTSQQICEDNGNTWDAVAEACITAGGLVNDDAKEGECDIKGDNFYWNRNNQTCVNRCPGGGLYNVTKDLCETTPSGNDPFASDHTTCAGITDYNQPAVNGVFPTVTQIFTAAEFEALGGTCPTHFGTTPTVTTPVCNIANAKLNELNECACEEGFAPVYTDGVLTACNASSSTPVCNIANAKLNELNECACEEGFAPVYTDGVLTACTKGGVTIPECPEGGYWDEAQQKCFCTGGYEPTYTDGKVTACTLIAGLDCSSIANAEINELNECGCKEGFTPVYTDGVLTACTKGTTIPGGCPANASKVNGVCKCKTDFTPVYADDGTTLIGCSPGGGDECPLNSTRNSAGNCDCDDDYTASVDGDGVMTCVPDFPAQNCTNPAWAATHVADCAKCADDEYAKDHPAICGIKEGTPYTRPYATFEGVDMVRPPWVTEATVNRPTEPRTYSILPAPSGNYEYGISSLARRPQDIRETVSVIDPGYEQIQAGGPPTFTMQDYLPDSEEAQRRQAARDKYYGAMNRLSDYSTQFNVGVDELSESLGVPQANFNAAPADGGFNIHGGNFNYATPTYGTPPEGYPTSPDLQAAENRPFYSPWLEEEEDSLFAHGGAVTEEPQGLESILQRRKNAVDNMFVKRGSGNGVR